MLQHESGKGKSRYQKSYNAGLEGVRLSSFAAVES
jgi:hypothetical protein